MRAVGFLIVVSALAACSAGEQRPDDPEAARFIATHPGMTERCKDIARKDVMAAFTLPEPACFEMTPEQHFKGLLNLGWEWSNFCPAPATECLAAPDNGGIWTEGSGMKDLPHGRGIFEVEFIGRKTVTPSEFRHLSQYDHFMSIDRLISARKVRDEVD